MQEGRTLVGESFFLVDLCFPLFRQPRGGVPNFQAVSSARKGSAPVGKKNKLVRSAKQGVPLTARLTSSGKMQTFSSQVVTRHDTRW